MLPPLLLLPLLWAERVTVQEGQCALVPCHFSYPREHYTERSPAYGYWFRYRESFFSTENLLVATNHQGQPVQKETQGRFHLLGDPRNYNCTLDIRDAKKGDTGTYFFRVEKGALKYTYTQYQLSVEVTPLTHRPDIHLPGTLQAGQPTSITCEAPWACGRATPPTFSWTGVSLGATGSSSSGLTLHPGPQHHGTHLTCRVILPGASVSTETTVLLSVAYAPQNLSIQVLRDEGSGPEALGNGSSLAVQEGQALRLVCVVHSNPPASLSWVHGRLTVKSSPSLNPQVAGGVWEHSQTLELALPRVHLEDHGEHVCCAQNQLGSQEASLSLSVRGPAGAGPGLLLGTLLGTGTKALLLLGLVLCIVKRRREKAQRGRSQQAPSPGLR